MRLKESEKSELERMTYTNNPSKMDLAASLHKTTKSKEQQQSKVQATITHEKAESYEEAFAKIEAATGIHDIDVLVKNFIQAEEKNFTLFKFVNELSNEIENLET